MKTRVISAIIAFFMLVQISAGAAYRFDSATGTYVWDFTDITEDTVSEAKTVDYNGLLIHLQQGDYINGSAGVFFSGNGAPETRCIEFVPEYNGTLKISYYMNNNPSKYMHSYIYDATSNSNVASTTSAGRSAAELTAEVVAGNTYYLYSTGNGSNNYAQQITKVLYTAPELAEGGEAGRTHYYSMGDNTEEDSNNISYDGAYTSEVGQKGNATNFSGGYAALNEFPLGECFTFSAWIKPKELSAWERLFDFGKGTGNYIFLTVNCGDNYPRLAVKNGGAEESITSSKALSIGVWSYMTVTMSYGSAIMYINGEQVSSGNIKIPVSDLKDSLNNYIAKSQYPNDATYKGCIDEIEIYNYAMTAEEIAENMASTAAEVKSIETVEDRIIYIGETASLPASLTVTYANDSTEDIPVKWNTPISYEEAGEFLINGTLSVIGKEMTVTAKVIVKSSSNDKDYAIGRSINYVKNTGIAYADAIYNIKTDNTDELTIAAEVYRDGEKIGNTLTKTITNANTLNGANVSIRIPLTVSGEITVKTSLYKTSAPEIKISETERVIKNETSYADTANIKLLQGSRLDESERVGLGYIMGIDLPRLVAPSYEVHGLTLTYGADDDAVKNGDKKAGDKVVRYGGWEALGAWKVNNVAHNTLAGQQMGHWLSAAAVFYNDLKNTETIELTAASLNGNDTSDTAPSAKGDTSITPQDIHDKMEYVIDKLDELQNTDIPAGWTATVNKEYIGGCDEIPFLNCFSGNGGWLGKYWVPWYNIHKVYQGLLDVYDYAEPELALKAYGVLKKLANWAANGTEGLTDAQMQSVLNVEYGGINEVFARMYEITGDEMYKTTSRRFTHNSIIDPLKTNNTASLSGKHANTQIPKFVGAAELYEQDTAAYADYRTACENFWNNVNYERCYAIGGNSLGEHFQPVGTEELGVKSCESCNTYNMMRLTEHLFSWEHKSEYMDWYERALYNHVLGQQEPETGAKMYFVSMVQGTHRIYEQKYNAWWCCTGTGMENPGRYTRVTYFEDNDDLYVNLYMPGTYTWTRKDLTLNVETNYPYEETVKITVTGGDMTGNVKLRAPGWLSAQNKQMTVTVNNDRKAVSDGGEYITLNSIKNGDVIELTMPMGVSLYRSRDNVKVAYEYGPMVLAAKLNGAIKPSYEYIWEERNTACQQVAYPVLITSDGKGINTADDITGYISKTGREGTLKFKLASENNSTGKDVELVPFIDITHNYHNIYFDLDTKIDEYGINLSNVQIDYVDPDGQQSELGHGMTQSTEDKTEFRSQSVQGLDGNGQYRYAYGKGGFFKYNMLVDKSADKNYLIIKYYDTDEMVSIGDKQYKVKFKILAGNTELMVDGKDYMDVKDGEGKFVTKLIEIPKSIVDASTQTDTSTGYNIIEIKLVPYDEESATVPYRRMYTTTDDPENMGANQIEKDLPETVEITSSENRISYTSKYGENADCDMYVALYDKDGVLIEVKMNKSAGEFIITKDEKYTVKVFFWTDMKPEYDPVVKEIQ